MTPHTKVLRLQQSRRRMVVGLIAAALAFVAVTVSADSAAWQVTATRTLVLVSIAAILLGEWYQLRAPGFRGSAPVATASALGLAYASVLPNGERVTYSASFVLAAALVCMAAVATLRSALHRPVAVIEPVGRLVTLAVVASAYRGTHLDEAAGGPGGDSGLTPTQTALVLLGISCVGLLLGTAATTTIRSLKDKTPWRRTLVEELRSSVALSSALAVTGILIALAVPAVGPWSVPLFLAPLALTLLAFRRYASVRATYRQSIRTLSRLTDIAGYTPAGHSERVAAFATAVGRELGLPERELLDLEYAALLHDIGQVALVDPIPGGATVLAAPADQRRIAADTVAIVRETGVLDAAAKILEHQTTPYRQLREFGEDIPLTSRIIKVVNAFEDLTAGSRSQRARSSAVERIYLGLGYEYDPHVVDALMRVLSGPRNGS